jgi:hypothetical protein
MTPPRRKAVQFNIITPLKTPQRRAPRLIFTPMKTIQSDLQSLDQDPSTNSMKPTSKGGAAALDAEDTLVSNMPRSLQCSPVDIVHSIPDNLVIDSDEATTPPSVMRSSSPLAVEDILANDDDSIESDIACSPTLHASRSVARPKRRVIYSSEDDSDGPNSTLPRRPSSTVQDQCTKEIEFLGENILHTQIQAKPVCEKTPPPKKSTKRQAGRRGVAKFIDDMASAVGGYGDDDSSDDDRDLRGFIVDDDYIEYEKDSAKENSEGSDYVLKYSPTTPKLTKAAPKKLILNVDLTETSDEDSPASPISSLPRPKPRPRQLSAKSLETPQKNRSEQRAWNEKKQKLAQMIMDDLDNLVFDGKLVKEWGVRAVWNNKLLTTAGRAHHKRFVR